MKARDVRNAILKATGATVWPGTVDTLKIGDPLTEVTGIVVTVMATVDVLRKAIKLKANLIVTHEPTFYDHNDAAPWHANDPVVAEKRRLIEQNGLAVLRFHDTWHAMEPDSVRVGMLRTLGWEECSDGPTKSTLTIPQAKLRALANHIAKRTDAKTLRVVGNPDMPCKRVALHPGAVSTEKQVADLRRDDVDVLVVGESREWETVEYARDMVQLGKHKALIVIGHCASEEGAMEYCAEWLPTILPDIPVHFVPAGEPFAVLTKSS